MTERSHKGLVQREIEVTRKGKKFKQLRWVKAGKDEPKEKPSKKDEPKSKGLFNVGDEINFLGKDLKIEKVSEKEQTIKINGKVYTFDAIKKGSSIKESKNNKFDPNIIIDGELPNYKSLPKEIKILDSEIKKMNSIVKRSKKLEKEIAAPISFKNNQMVIGKGNIGNESSCNVDAGTDSYAIYHTHPNIGIREAFDSFSLSDVMTVTTNHRLQRTNIMMAHTVKNGNLWVCIPSTETMDEIDNGMSDIMGTQKFVMDIQNKIKTAVTNDDEKMCQKAIKEYCDKFKMKLYYGQPNNLKEF